MQFWVEKTRVASRPDRQQGEFAFGKALWSPQTGKDGRDTYRLMRQVKPGDVVFHLVDNKAIVGVSMVAGERDDTVVVPEGTQWPAGKPAFLIRLHRYTKLTQSIERSDYLENPRYRSDLLEIATKNDALFYSSKLELNQGAYLTIAPLPLIEIWEEIHFQKTGTHLPLIDPNLLSNLPESPQPHPIQEESASDVAPVAEDQAREYLETFKKEAKAWFAKATFLKNYLEFFRKFFNRENLEQAEWSDIQKIGAHLHCFQSVSLAKANALGRPNHPIEHYRKSFIYLAHGPGEPVERVRRFCTHPEYRLDGFGKAAVSELVGYLFPDEFMFFNARDEFAAQLLGIKVEKKAGGDLVGTLEAFSRATRPLAKLYEEIVGRQTVLPLNLEVDQFFSWLYENERNETRPMPSVATPPASSGGAYWWLNANPKIWDFEDTSVGQRQTYTSYSEKGHKRQKYKYFQEVKPGDWVVGYVTSPQREVVAVCKITKALHQTEAGEKFEFEKVEQLARPIAYETLQAIPDLANSEPLINNQGSLFKLTEPEYEIIRSLIDETNIPLKSEFEHYDKQKAMKELFLAESQFDEMLMALKEKKNLVLQGAPGVGKTYVAKRLAYALVGSNDPQRVEMIQFHQSYSYEDFIQGFRPTPKGHFELKYGVFHQFCRRVRREEAHGKPYVFIIDEINRGNLSKIFGELMMLIEPDKRGKEYAIPLAYSQDADEKFYIPENLHLIGMMNTADRSLAMVDYALRRRFRFVTLRPEFTSKAFREFLQVAGLNAELTKKILDRMATLNEVIAADTKNLGPGYQIGHSYFCPQNGIKPDDNWYCRVIESEIVPLIQEYWFDNEQKVKERRDALLA